MLPGLPKKRNPPRAAAAEMFAMMTVRFSSHPVTSFEVDALSLGRGQCAPHEHQGQAAQVRANLDSVVLTSHRLMDLSKLCERQFGGLHWLDRLHGFHRLDRVDRRLRGLWLLDLGFARVLHRRRFALERAARDPLAGAGAKAQKAGEKEDVVRRLHWVTTYAELSRDTHAVW